MWRVSADGQRPRIALYCHAGAAVKRKRILLWLGAASVAAAALAQLMPAESPIFQPLASARSTQPSAANRASERFAALPSREPIGEAKGALFGPRSWDRVAAGPSNKAAPSVVEKPVPPPVPYRIAGQVVTEHGMRLVLSKGDRVFEVRPGESLEDGYRVESIAPHVVTFVYVPLGITQEVPVVGTGLELPPPRQDAHEPPQAFRAAVVQ
jgi:hypothetical protein